MTGEEALERARAIAAEKGWPWLDPVSVRKVRPFLLGSVRWVVMTNAERRGMNVRIVLDDASGRILAEGYLPR